MTPGQGDDGRLWTGHDTEAGADGDNPVSEALRHLAEDPGSEPSSRAVRDQQMRDHIPATRDHLIGDGHAPGTGHGTQAQVNYASLAEDSAVGGSMNIGEQEFSDGFLPISIQNADGSGLYLPDGTINTDPSEPYHLPARPYPQTRDQVPSRSGMATSPGTGHGTEAGASRENPVSRDPGMLAQGQWRAAGEAGSAGGGRGDEEAGHGSGEAPAGLTAEQQLLVRDVRSAIGRYGSPARPGDEEIIALHRQLASGPPGNRWSTPRMVSEIAGRLVNGGQPLGLRGGAIGVEIETAPATGHTAGPAAHGGTAQAPAAPGTAARPASPASAARRGGGAQAARPRLGQPSRRPLSSPGCRRWPARSLPPTARPRKPDRRTRRRGRAASRPPRATSRRAPWPGSGTTSRPATTGPCARPTSPPLTASFRASGYNAARRLAEQLGMARGVRQPWQPVGVPLGPAPHDAGPARAIVERWDHFDDDSQAPHQAHVSYVGTVLRARGEDAAVALARLLGAIRGARQPGPPGAAPQAGAAGLAALLSSPPPAASRGAGWADPALAGRVAAMDARRLDAAWGKLRPGPDLDAAQALARWLAGGYQHLPLTIRDVPPARLLPQEQAVLRVAYYLHATRGDLHGASHLARQLTQDTPPQAVGAAPGGDGAPLDHLTAAASAELRRPALAAAGRKATRDDVQRAFLDSPASRMSPASPVLPPSPASPALPDSPAQSGRLVTASPAQPVPPSREVPASLEIPEATPGGLPGPRDQREPGTIAAPQGPAEHGRGAAAAGLDPETLVLLEARTALRRLGSRANPSDGEITGLYRELTSSPRPQAGSTTRDKASYIAGYLASGEEPPGSPPAGRASKPSTPTS